MVSTAALRPYANNSREHSADQLAALAASIREFGFTAPILVGSDNTIIAGHARLAAAQEVGLETVPVVRLEHLSAAQQRALVIADNRLAELASWDREVLARELADLAELDFDLGGVGFSDKEMAELLAEFDAELSKGFQSDPEEVPSAPKVATTRPGDVWALGNHRLLCGDSTRERDVERLVDKGEADTVWTDPPYNVNCEGAAGSIENDNMDPAAFRRFIRQACRVMFGRLREGGAIYVAHADTEGVTFRTSFEDAGFKLSGCLVWVKPALVLGRSDYQWRHEPILYGWRPGAAHFWAGGRAETTVAEYDGADLSVMEDGSLQIPVGDRVLVVRGEGLSIEEAHGSVLRAAKPKRNAEHPTMKPVDLIGRMLGNSTPPSGLVFDPFGGSGSTLMACEARGRRARLVELEPRFCDVILRRWEEATGGTANLEETGATFAEVAEARGG